MAAGTPAAAATAVAAAPAENVRKVFERAEADRLGPLARTRIGVAIVAAFIAATIAMNAPSWLNDPGSIERHPLEQRWNLFAPDPPSANLTTLLLVRSRNGRGPDEVRSIDLSAAVRDNSRSQRLHAPKLVRVVTKLNVALEDVVEDGEAVRDHPELLESYRRMLSAAAVDAAGSRVVSVRGLVVRGAVRPFHHRSVRSIDPEELLYDSGWMDFSSDVEPMKVL